MRLNAADISDYRGTETPITLLINYTYISQPFWKTMDGMAIEIM